ncbi:MAG TPA: VOC family protein [Devosiaceae bacterium]|jgi:uncharacterized glyoxalase superfamily protein PhnB
MLSNRSMPDSIIIPELAYVDIGQAADWLCNAFGFSARLWIADHRAQLVLDGGAIVLTQTPALAAGVNLMVRVEHLDAHYERSTAAGAEIVREPESYPFGERQYTCRDPGGHVWTFSQSIADMDPVTWGGVLVTKP